MPTYLIVWKYNVKPEYKEKFEFEYGVDGTWNALFRKSKNYTSSFLHISEIEPDTYLLIDTWTTKECYEKFIQSNNADYKKLSSKLDYLYESEEKIGLFHNVE